MVSYLEYLKIKFDVFSGNAGGYLGLFLGYAILNIPDLIAFVIGMIKNWNSKRNVEEKDLEAEDKEARRKLAKKTTRKVKAEDSEEKVSRKESSMPDVI